MLFDPLSVALGAATGELVFSEIMLGQFGGIGELEKFLTVTIAIYIAGTLVRDPRNLKAVAAAAIGATALQLAMSAGVDILKVVFAVEEFEAVPGLPESVFFTEGFAFLNDLLFSGILFFLPAPHALRVLRPTVTIPAAPGHEAAYGRGRARGPLRQARSGRRGVLRGGRARRLPLEKRGSLSRVGGRGPRAPAPSSPGSALPR